MDPGHVLLLLCIFVGVPILAIVGLVVTVRAIWRAVAGASSDAIPEERVQCGSCGRWSPKSRYRCEGCGRSLLSGEAIERADQAAFLRHLQRLREAKVLEPDLVNDLVARTGGVLPAAGRDSDGPRRPNPHVGRIGNLPHRPPNRPACGGRTATWADRQSARPLPPNRPCRRCLRLRSPPLRRRRCCRRSRRRFPWRRGAGPRRCAASPNRAPRTSQTAAQAVDGGARRVSRGAATSASPS